MVLCLVVRMADSEIAPTQMLKVARDPLVETIIGERYRVLARIGEGGMGTVFRVEHTHMKKVLALKLLRSEYSNVEDAARRFEREAQSASRLSHPNIISVTDFGHGAAGELFLVMEFVAGEPLSDVLARDGRMQPARACHIASQILLALEHAHEQGVIHRDLKPANVMLVKDPDPGKPEAVKILDFGIAKMTQAQGTTDEPLTRGMMIFGTPAYMSPEQAAGQDADGRADLYSCAVILFEMLTGRRPFQCDDLVKLLAMQITAQAPRFAEVAPDVRIAPELESVVMRGLEKDRTQRFATAGEFRAAIERSSTDVAELGARFAAKSVRMSITAGAKLWARRDEAVALSRRVWTRILEIKGKLDKLAGPVLERLPVAIRRFVIPAVAALLLVVLLWPGGAPRKGASLKAEPPKLKPVAAELKSPIKHIEETMAQGQLTEARVLIMQQISAHPNEGRVRYLLGNLEFADKNPSAGLQAYEEALRLDPGLRGDAALLVNIRSELGDKKVGFIALEMLIKQVGKPASALLIDIASDDRRPEFRKAARDACETLGCTDKVDLVGSYALDLSQAHTCEDKRAAVQKLGEMGDPKAIEPLRKARSERRSLLGGFLSTSGNACVVKDIDAALTALGAPPPPPPPTKRRRR
jgi:eukaryotic-like serine/threonine-protein kinase